MTKYQKAAETRKKNTVRRYQRIQQRANELYKAHVGDLRPDFNAIVVFLSNEFGIAQSTVKKALKYSV